MKEILNKLKIKLDPEMVRELFTKYEINNKKRMAMFFAQCGHESMNFTRKIENLNYSANRLRVVFPKYFKDMDTAERYARDQKAIGSRIYANRMGNGSEATSEGYVYRGRGYIQLTGKSNYEEFRDFMGFKTMPETISYIETDKGALESALFFWKKRDLNKLCDKDDVRSVSRIINGGYNGLEDRMKRYADSVSLCDDLVVEEDIKDFQEFCKEYEENDMQYIEASYKKYEGVLNA